MCGNSLSDRRATAASRHNEQQAMANGMTDNARRAQNWRRIAWFTLCIAAPCWMIAAGGCRTLGRPVVPVDTAAGAPHVETVLRDLAANDSAIAGFRAGGAFLVEAPELKAAQRFPFGTVAYRKPGQLFVEGRNNFGGAAFRLTSSG